MDDNLPIITIIRENAPKFLIFTTDMISFFIGGFDDHFSHEFI